MGPYADFDFYKREYEWYMEQMRIESTERLRVQDRRAASTHGYSPHKPVYWIKREDNVMCPIVKHVEEAELKEVVPVVVHSWQRRQDGVLEPFPPNPLCAERLQTRQSCRDHVGAKRLLGTIKANRRRRIIKYGLPVSLSIRFNNDSFSICRSFITSLNIDISFGILIVQTTRKLRE